MEKRICICELGIQAAIKALDEYGILWCRVAHGVWNKPEKEIPVYEAVEEIKQSGYGATVWLVYDGDPKMDDSNLLYTEVLIPHNSDMY